jgi:hypothetical protein
VTLLLSKGSIDTEPAIYNVAASKPWSLNDLFEITSQLGIRPRIITSGADSLDVQITHGSVEKLKIDNIQVPDTSLQSGIEQTWKWIKDQNLGDLRSWFEYKA